MDLLREGVDHLPRAITNEVSTRERLGGCCLACSDCFVSREAVYKRGGVVFITSRILVVDLLRRQCPVSSVSGLLIWSAHKYASLHPSLCVCVFVCVQGYRDISRGLHHQTFQRVFKGDLPPSPSSHISHFLQQTGFIKAFSDSPEQFLSGFCQLERVMRCLFLRHLYLWPRQNTSSLLLSCPHILLSSVCRFHATVSSSLATHKVCLNYAAR